MPPRSSAAVDWGYGEDAPMPPKKKARTDTRKVNYSTNASTNNSEDDVPEPVSQSIRLDMNEMPPSTIHKYVLHYNLVPQTAASSTVYGNVSLQAPLTFQQAVMPCPSTASYYTHPRLLAAKQAALVLNQAEDEESDMPSQDPLADLVEGTCDELKTPAYEGQEPDRADSRLVDLVTAHWDRQTLKEGETIVNFCYAIRMKNKILKSVPFT